MASSSVSGSRETIVCATGSSRESRPRSPRSARPSQRAYCTGSGRSRPYLWRICATTAGSRSSPPSASAASPGIARTPTNTSTLATNRTTRAAPTFRRRKLPMVARSCCLDLLEGRELGPDQPVAEELDAAHLLAHAVARDGVVEVDQRPVAPDDPDRGAVERLARALALRVARVVEDDVEPRVRVARVVLRPLRVDELVDVAVGID